MSDRILPFVLAALTLTACARPQVVAHAPAPPPPPAPVEEAAPPAPDGELACRTKDAFGVTTEVYLRGARGTLRRLTPSGMNEQLPLEVERHGDALIGDLPASEDLAVHAVTLRRAEGKAYVRLGDRNQSWSACL
jgi:hypothetical protein